MTKILSFIAVAAFLATPVVAGPAAPATVTKAQACHTFAIIKTAPPWDKCHDPASAICRNVHHKWDIAVAGEEKKCMKAPVNLDAAAALAEECSGPIMTVPEKCSPLIRYE